MLWFVLALGAAFFLAIYFYEMKRLLSGLDEHLVAGIVFLATGLLFSIVSLSSGLPELGDGFMMALLASVVFGVAANAFYVHALRISDLSLIAPMSAFTPLFLVFLSPLILGEMPAGGGIIGILLIVGGSYILNLDSRHDLLSPLRGFISDDGIKCAFMASLLFAFRFNFEKMMTTNSDVLFAPAVSFLLVGAIFLAHFHLRGGRTPGLSGEDRKTFLLAIIASFLVVMLLYMSWTLEMVPYVISVYRTSALFSVLIGGYLLHEKGFARHLMGCLLMVIGAALILLL